MKLTNVHVEGLFGIFNHPIKLHSDGITLVLGENGFGKTVILKLITAFFEGKFVEINRFDFKTFTLTFDKEAEVIIYKNSDDLTVINQFRGVILDRFKPLEDRYISTNMTPASDWLKIFPKDLLYRSNDRVSLLEQFLPPYIRRVQNNLWLDERTQRVYSQPSIIRKFKNHVPESLFVLNELPTWLTGYIETYKVKLIETQRLLNLLKAKEGSSPASVTKFSQEIVDKIKNLQAQANILSTNLDRTFPTRLINRVNDTKKYDKIELQNNLQALEEKRKLLTTVGLIDSDESYIPSQNLSGGAVDVLNSVIDVYIEDSNKKIAIYLAFASRLRLFLDIINKRFLYKKITINKDEGFVITSNKNQSIPLTSLSSGEQHELVLVYELLFNTEANCLLLIDEPEISFHISWQQEFMKDLKEVVKLNPMQVIIATHSPDIINTDWHLTVQLERVK